jgi:hypothetical protein
MAFTAIMALLVKVAPFLLQLISIMMPTEAGTDESTIANTQTEQDNLAKTGRPSW